MKNNTAIYAEYGIFGKDTNAIAAAISITGPYDKDAVDRIVAVHKAAKASGLSLTRYLESLQEAKPGEEYRPPADEPAQAVGAAIDVQASIQFAASAIVAGGEQLYSQIDEYCGQTESAVAGAFVGRINQVPQNTAIQIVEGLKDTNPKFFRLAPEGVQLPSFVFGRSGTVLVGAETDGAIFEASVVEQVESDVKAVQ